MTEMMFDTGQSLNSQSMTVEDIQNWCAAQVADQLGVDPDDIDLKAPFNSFGLDSVQLMSITNLGKQYFGLPISPLVIWNYPNIESLSHYLAQKLQSSDREVLEL